MIITALEIIVVSILAFLVPWIVFLLVAVLKGMNLAGFALTTLISLVIAGAAALKLNTDFWILPNIVFDILFLLPIGGMTAWGLLVDEDEKWVQRLETKAKMADSES